MDEPGSTRRVLQKERWVQIVDLEALALKVTGGPDRGLTASLPLPAIRVGTSRDNDLVLTDSSVSRHHCRLLRTPEGWLLTDLGSTNGTFVTDLRVKEAVVSLPASVRVGETSLLLMATRTELCAIPEEGTEFSGLVGKSAGMRELFALVKTVAPTVANVLIEAESGCGKEVLARALHENSGRPGPLVIFDCASTGPEMIRSELFGHVKGAFTGAADSRKGAFRSAHGGTLFIDELGELPLALQPILLRVLESREVTALGADRPVAVNVRVIAATNRDLAAMVSKGSFRQDLLNRLATIRVRVPPLRERAEDLPLLIDHFSRQLGVRCVFTPEALHALESHTWPGNVRDLRNLVERMTIFHPGREVQVQDLGAWAAGAAPPPAGGGLPLSSLSSSEEELIRRTLEATGGNKVQAARRLGIDITTLRRKLKRMQ